MFALLPNRSTRGHCFKTFLTRVRQELRKRFFSVRVVITWSSLSTDTVTATYLETFNKLLKRDMAG